MNPPDPIRQRRPGGGRKPAPYSPVLPVSVSMSMDERRRIDRAALATNRSRSAFILRACYDAIERLGLLDPEASPDVMEPRRLRGIGVWDEPTSLPAQPTAMARKVDEYLARGAPTFESTPEQLAHPISRAERERRLDADEDPAAVWAAFGDPTRGGTWNPARYGGVIECVACPATIPTGAVYCMACGVEQPEALKGMR